LKLVYSKSSIILFLFLIVQTVKYIIKAQNIIKNQTYQTIARMIHQKNNQKTFARFCINFDGAAEAFISISFKLLKRAKVLLYDSKNKDWERLIQAAYHILFITANHISIQIFLPSAKTHINKREVHDNDSQKLEILYIQYLLHILLKKFCNQNAGIAIIQSSTYHHQVISVSKNDIKKVAANVSQNQNTAHTAKLQ